MSAAQVQKLEALLQRVQHNRGRARTPGANVTAAGVPAPAAQLAPEPARAASMGAAAAASVAARPARERLSTPLEMAVEGELNRPASAPAPRAPSQAQQPPRPAPAQPARQAPEPRAPTPQPMPRASVAQPAAAQPSRIDSASIAPPSKPIANVVSKHPSTEASSFGQLLSRSLRLRPR